LSCITPGDGSGIGISPLPPLSKSAHGRKSNMSKAITQAGLNVAQGRQHPINKVLRALTPLPPGPP